MHWLERGEESDPVLILASERTPTIHEHSKLFERFLAERGATLQGTNEQDFWILTRFLLQHIANENRDPFPEASDLITEVHWKTGDDLQLFLRPDLPPVEKRHPPAMYAGETTGLEHVVGAIFSLDNIEEIEKHAFEVARIKQSIREEAAKALARFYTQMPERFPATPL